MAKTGVVTDLSTALVAAGAALGASALTIAGTYGLERIRERRAAKSARAGQRRRIYLEILTATGAMMVNSAHARAVGDMTSKWAHSLNQIMKRSPAQPTIMEILSLFHEPMDRLMQAWADAYLVFEQDEIDAVNSLVAAVQKRDFSVPLDDPRSGEAQLGAARREFTTFARSKLGESFVRLEVEARVE